MNGESTNQPSIAERYPQAHQWLVNLLRHAPPPHALRADVELLKLSAMVYLGVPARSAGILSRNMEASLSQDIAPPEENATTICPICAQPTLVDCSKEKCPKCKKTMKLRRNRTSGEAFLGCSGYPECNGTKNLSKLAQEQATARQLSRRVISEETRMIIVPTDQELI